MAVQIGKTDTLEIIYNNRKIVNQKNRYVFTTKYYWKCLGCLTDIFVSYDQFGVCSVFCEKCISLSNSPNIVTYQYVRVLKDKQIELIESFEQE